jgi:hypothetical protein
MIDKVTFDWEQDHSAWRLTDDEIVTIAIGDGLTMLGDAWQRGPIRDRDDVERLARQLAQHANVLLAHADAAENDADELAARRAADHAEELANVLEGQLDDTTQCFDAENAYDNAVEIVEELLEQWDKQYHVGVSPQHDTAQTARALWQKSTEDRDGLGEKWTVEINDDTVTFTARGRHGSAPDWTVTAVPANMVDTFTELADTFDINVDGSGPWDNVNAETILETLKQHPDIDHDTMVDTVRTLLDEWTDTLDTLLEVAAKLS